MNRTVRTKKAQYHQALPQNRQNKNPQEASETNTLRDSHLNGILPLILCVGQQAYLKNVCREREGRSKQPEEQRRADMVAIRHRSMQHPGCNQAGELLPAYLDQANCGGVILLKIQDIWSLLARPNPDAAAVNPAVKEEEETKTCLLATCRYITSILNRLVWPAYLSLHQTMHNRQHKTKYTHQAASLLRCGLLRWRPAALYRQGVYFLQFRHKRSVHLTTSDT